MLLITAALVLLSVAAVWFVRAHKPKRKSSTRRRHQHTAVELLTGTDCCTKAKELAGKRLLIAEAPVLPLDGCLRCRCAYKRLGDRRELNRRREDDGLQELLLYVGEQKRQRNRRDG